MAIQTRKIKDIAQALVESAQEAGVVAEVMRSVHLVGSAVQTHRRFLAEYADVTVPLEERRHALEKTFQESVNPFVLNALYMLQEIGELKNYKVFADATQKAAETLAKHYEIKLTSVVPLEPKERDAIAQALAEKFGGTQHLHEETDPALLGGIQVQVGDWTFDASVKGKIDRLKRSLIGER